MIDKLTDEEKFLLLGKVTGSLSREEEDMLEQLFRDNPDAGVAYEELVQNIPADDAVAYLADGQPSRAWKDITADFRREASSVAIKRLPYYRRYWLAAAAVSGILALASILLIRQTSTHPGISAIRKAGIILKLANGQVIDLSATEGAINTGTAQLTNQHRSLSYSSTNTPPTAMNTLTVPIGMDYKVNLSDGSEVWLNAATKMQFPLAFNNQTREITINGEAYIKVTKDASRPFIVHLPQSNVQVLGTEFNINTYDPGVEKVALVTGAVSLKTPNGDAMLPPGQQAVYTTGQPIVQTAFDAKYVLSWRKGLFYFNDATLSDISTILPRWYGIQVVIDNPAIKTRRFTGVINRNQPIASFLDDLKTIARIDYRFDKDSTLFIK